MKNYELIEHTADIGVRVKGKDLKDLFKNTALSMFDIIAEQRAESREPRHKDWRVRQEFWRKRAEIKVKQSADNLEELFINWLNELLSLSATKELIFTDFKLDKLDEKTLEATVLGEDIKNYKVNTEIKAATYHELKLEQTKSVWQAEVIFDV